MRQHRAAGPPADRRGVDDQQRGVRVDVQAGVRGVAAGQERLVAVVGISVVAQPQRGLAGRAGCPRRAHGAADLLLLPDHHLRAEVLDREGHLRRGPAPVAGAHHRPDLGRRAEQLVDPEGVLAEPQDAHPRPDPGRAQRVGQPVDPLVQFGPGQAVFPVGQRQPARVAAAVLGDDVPDGDHGFTSPSEMVTRWPDRPQPHGPSVSVPRRPSGGLAHLVRPRARGADEQLPAALGQGPLRAVEMGAAAVRALHREGGPDPGDDERLGARPGQQAGGVRPGHDDRHPRHDRGELVAQALGHGPVEAEDHRDGQPARVHAGAERLEGVDLPDRIRRAELAGRGLERVEPGRFRHAADETRLPPASGPTPWSASMARAHATSRCQSSQPTSKKTGWPATSYRPMPHGPGRGSVAAAALVDATVMICLPPSCLHHPG